MIIRKNIRFLATLLAILLVMVFAAGCGSPQTEKPASGETSGQSETPSSSAEPVELHFSHFTSNLHHLNVEVYEPFAKEVEEKTRLDPLSLENIHLKHYLYLKLLCFRAAALDMGPLVSMFHRASQGQLQLTLCGPLPKAG